MEIRVGTSGYATRNGRAASIPRSSRPRRCCLLCRALPTVEINNTFYRMPEEPVLERGPRRCPTASVRAQGAAAHHPQEAPRPDVADDRRLPVRDRRGARATARARALPAPAEPQEGPRAAARLPRPAAAPARRAAFEFRHPSWLDDEVHEVLRDAGRGAVRRRHRRSGAERADRRDRRLGLPAAAPRRLRRRGARAVGRADPRPALESLRVLQARRRPAARLARDRALPGRPSR